jgi:hypothetical protein
MQRPIPATSGTSRDTSRAQLCRACRGRRLGQIYHSKTAASERAYSRYMSAWHSTSHRRRFLCPTTSSLSFPHCFALPLCLGKARRNRRTRISSTHKARESGLPRFWPQKGGKIEVNVSQLPPGIHGIHIHNVGGCEGPDFMSAGPHLNP